MEESETTAHSFIIRLWFEEPPDSVRHVRWRGHITHVLTGKRVYVESLVQVADFIAMYMEPHTWRHRWLRRLHRWLLRIG